MVVLEALMASGQLVVFHCGELDNDRWQSTKHSLPAFTGGYARHRVRLAGWMSSCPTEAALLLLPR